MKTFCGSKILLFPCLKVFRVLPGCPFGFVAALPICGLDGISFTGLEGELGKGRVKMLATTYPTLNIVCA